MYSLYIINIHLLFFFILILQNSTREYILYDIVTVKIQTIRSMIKKYKRCNWQTIKQDKCFFFDAKKTNFFRSYL